jgi:hypothetical protein
MAAAYSVSIVARALPVGPTVIAAPVAGTFWVIRDVTSFQTVAAPNQVAIRIANSDAPVVIVLAAATLQYSHWTGRIVVPPGVGLSIGCTGAGASVSISGYQLTTG